MVGLLLVVLLGVVPLLIWWLRGVYSYWQSKGVVQPPVVLGFGNYMEAFLGRDNPGLIVDKIYRLFPEHDAFGLYSLLTPRLVVRSPELVKQVMASEFSSFHDNEFYVKEELDPLIYKDPFAVRGEEWKPSRTKFIPFVTQSRMKEIFPLMKESLVRMDEYIGQNLEKDIEAKELATLFTMDNVSSCVFGISSNCFTDPEAAFRKMGTLQMNEGFQGFWSTVVLLLLPSLRDLLGVRIVPKVVAKYIENMVLEVKEHRLKNNYVRNDLMHHMLNKSGDELMGHAFTFFLEGFETSAMVASSALYELAMNPEIQETLHEELKDLSGSMTSEFDTLWSLPYLDKVVQETMRKYPVVYELRKLCTKDTTMEIDGQKVDIKKGTPVMVPVYSIHNDPRYYPNPEVFDPERFSEQEIASRIPYTYMPLGEGPRICAGFRFGLTQVKVFVAHLVLKYRILSTEKTPSRLTPDKYSVLVVPVEQKWMKLEARK